MHLVIVSGLSGAGKSIALNTLEDHGYYCVDNLPTDLLETFALHLVETGCALYRHTGVGIDARNRPEDLADFPAVLGRLRAAGIDTVVVYLQASEEALVKRFSETRRRHPLTGVEAGLGEALELERELLEPVASQADLIIDTTHTNVHQLRELIGNRVAPDNDEHLSLLFQSFGYKHGVPADADFVFDARCLPNPYWEPGLQAYTGLDAPVREFLERDPRVEALFGEIRGLIERWLPCFTAENRSYLTVAVGCTGGQHRSVYLVDRLAAHFRPRHARVLTLHRELT